MKKTYVGLSETSQDGEWLYQKLKKLTGQRKIIAISLESLEFLRQKNDPDIEILHIWNLVDMDTLLDSAHEDALRGSEDWVKIFKSDFDIAIQHRLHAEFFPHAYASWRLAQELARLFSAQHWTYVSAPFKYFFLSVYALNYQVYYTQNFLFKTICDEIFKKHGLKIGFLPLVLFFNILKEIIASKWRYLKDVLKLRPTLRKLIRQRVQTKFDAIITGWGRDLSRMLSLEKLEAEHRAADSKKRILNVIWRSDKIAIPQSRENFVNLIIREDLKAGTTRGPRLSMFTLYDAIKGGLYFWFKLIRPRFSRIYSASEFFSLTDLLKFAGFRATLAFNVYFALWEAFWTEKLLSPILRSASPSKLVGSDSGGVSARLELLVAKKAGITTFSTPHGYQAYALPKYNYLADFALTPGRGTSDQLKFSGLTEEKIKFIGTSHLKRDEPVPINARNVRIVIGTRSWAGLWSNAASRHNVYDQELRSFLQKILTKPIYSATIKSHPNGDYHGYYDLLVKKFSSKRIQHIPKGWKPEKFSAETDILICFGDAPSLLISAAYLKIPIVFVTRTMTKAQARMNYDYANLAAVVSSASEAFAAIKQIVDQPSIWQAALNSQEKFLARYTSGDKPEKKLLQLIL